MQLTISSSTGVRYLPFSAISGALANPSLPMHFHDIHSQNIPFVLEIR